MNPAELVAALTASGTLRKRAALIYECDTRACALLYVYVIAGQAIAHQPPYKLSNDVNRRESVPESREKNTTDGNRRWNGETFPMSAAGGHLHLQCNHIRARAHVDTIAADIAAATRQPEVIPVAHGSVR